MTQSLCVAGGTVDEDGVCLEHGETACVIVVQTGPLGVTSSRRRRTPTRSAAG